MPIVGETSIVVRSPETSDRGSKKDSVWKYYPPMGVILKTGKYKLDSLIKN